MTEVMMEISSSKAKVGDKLPPAPETCGMWFVLAAMILNMISTGKFAQNGLAELLESIGEQGLGIGDDWITSMNGIIEQIDQDIHIKDPNERGAAVGRDTAKLNVRNTLYNQAASYFEGLQSSLKENMGDTNSVSALEVKTLQESVLVQLSKLFAA